MGTHVPGKSLGPRTTSASRPRPGLALSGCHQTWPALSVGSLPKRMAAVCGATAAQPRRVATNRRNQPPQNDQKRRAGMRTAGTRKQTIQQDNIKPCRSATPRPNDALRRGAGEQAVCSSSAEVQSSTATVRTCKKAGRQGGRQAGREGGRQAGDRQTGQQGRCHTLTWQGGRQAGRQAGRQ